MTDTSNHRIISFPSGSAFGTVVAGNSTAGLGRTQLWNPRTVFLDQFTNSMVICNRAANNIVRWGFDQLEWTLIAGSSSGTAGNSSQLFRAPSMALLDVLGNMYVADDQNHRVQFFPSASADGITIAGESSVLGTDGEHLHYPSSLALDNQLNLYVADQYNHRIQLFERY